MADELEFYGDPSADSGLTVVARVYNSAGAQVGSDVSCAEVGVLAIYQGDMPTAGAGTYGVRFFNGTTLLAQSFINWDGAAEVTNQTLDVKINTIDSIQDGVVSDVDDIQNLVSNIPSNPLTDNDARLNNLDATISSRLATSGYTVPPTTAQIEAALLNEGDGQQLIDAIVQAIGNVNVDQIALIAAIRADLERNGGMLDTVPTLAEIEASTVIAKTSDVTALNNLSSADVQTAVASSLSTYDAATNSAIASVQTAVIGEVNANETKIDGIVTSVAAILADTNELQTNQGDWATATGFSTFDASTDGVIVTTNNDKTDYFISGSISRLDGLNTVLTTQHTTTQTAISNLNNLSAADVTGAVPTASQIATATEQAILNESDGEQVLNAIVGAIGNTNVDQVALVAAIRTDLERNGGMLDGVPTLSEIEASSVIAKTTDITALNNVSIADVETAIGNQEPLTANITQVGGVAVAGVNDFKADVTGVATQASVDTANNVLALINKYHDNDTKFFGSDGTTEVIQSEAYFMTVYDNDGTTVLKRVEFKDSSGTASTLADATRYEKTP